MLLCQSLQTTNININTQANAYIDTDTNTTTITTINKLAITTKLSCKFRMTQYKMRSFGALKC